MIYLVFSVLCSVLVSVHLKLSARYHIDISQAITWGYLIAASFCALFLQPDISLLAHQQTPWLVLAVLAILLPSLFLILAHAVAVAGIVRTDIAQRLSLLLSVLAAFLWFSEPIHSGKLIGLSLGLVAVVGILHKPATTPKASHSWLWLLLVWLGFALVDILLKKVATAGIPRGTTLFAIFSSAFVLMVGVQLWRRWQKQIPLRFNSFLAGLLLGALNFGNILFYVLAHQAMAHSPATVFATMNIGVVVLGTLTGVIFFHEKTTYWNRGAIALAVVAIILITAQPK